MTYSVQVDGLDAFPDVVLVLRDDGATLPGYLSFTAGKASHQVARGGSRQSLFGSPDLYLMPKEAFETWSAAASAEEDAQMQACDERGEGCAHISRFVPRLTPPPAGSETACGAKIAIRTTTPANGPDAILDTFTLTAASPGTCTLTGPVRTATQGGKPVEIGMAGTAPASTGSAPSESSQCATVTGAASGVWGLLLLGLGWRRRDTRP